MTNTIDPGGSPSAIDPSGLAALLESVQGYFELMHDCDLSRFDRVFAPTVQLHGFRDGAMVCWSAQTYQDVLAKRQSPKSLGSPRADEILMIDLAAATQAFMKMRVRITATIFVDYLTWHRIDGRWLARPMRPLRAGASSAHAGTMARGITLPPLVPAPTESSRSAGAEPGTRCALRPSSSGECDGFRIFASLRPE